MADQEINGHERPEQSEENAVARRLRQLVAKVANDGVGPITGSAAYAEARLSKVRRSEPQDDETAQEPWQPASADIERVIQRLIKESVAASSTNGFVTGLGGFVTMPITLPANMAGALVINARLAGAIAYLRGYDLRDPHVQTIVTLAAAGSSLASSLQAVGVKIGTKLTAQAIKALPVAVIRRINARVGFMLLAKYGTQRSAVTLAKGIPFVGGVVGGGVDATLTIVVGRAARASFPAEV